MANIPMVSVIMQAVSYERLVVVLTAKGDFPFMHGSQFIEDKTTKKNVYRAQNAHRLQNHIYPTTKADDCSSAFVSIIFLLLRKSI